MRLKTEFFFTNLVGKTTCFRFIHCRLSFLNERLAGHYGIAGVRGNELRRIVPP